MATAEDRFLIVKSRNTGSRFKVDQWTSEHEMRCRCPKFFQTPHGKRETYTIHRGQLIVRNTVQFTGCKPERRTVVYLYVIESLDDKLHGTPDTLCVSSQENVNSIAQAKRLIDRLLDNGEC